jgi:F0F1-type ATP synthase membrane subunit b/b'
MVLQLQLQIKAGLELPEIFNETGEQEEPTEAEPLQEYEHQAEETIEEEKDSIFKEVELELKKLKERASRDIDSKFSKARKDLNLKKEEET